ncbi:MurR/RpiR family transcriptional regulator [Peribacillus kribbensis]|uniref:MurR/RpiR family transcriptional regulator n=1 Tax=Peribacillus kribbensis TaxID=356658 RepID=UPI0003FCDA35|nr:MurR/RpiR family transcriptional regulator [Peribacillus kribbensis]
MNENCLGRIRSSYSKFSEKEKKVADYILSNPEVIVHRTINDVADDLGLADATVFRFSKRIGYKGFQAMKIALASEYTTPAAPDDEDEIKESSLSVTDEYFQVQTKILQSMKRDMNLETISQAVDLVRFAENVVIFAGSKWTAIANEASQRFTLAGIKAHAVTNPLLQPISASLMNQKEAAIVLTDAFNDEETSALLNSIKKTGAKAIIMTLKPITNVSLSEQIILYTGIEETDPLLKDLGIRLSFTCYTDILCLKVQEQMKQVNQQ